MNERDTGFLRSLKAEQVQLENALERAEHQVSRFPRNHKRERSMKAIRAHLARIDRTIKEAE